MYSVDEDDGTVMIMVLLSQSSTQDISVTLSTSDVTADGEMIQALHLLMHNLRVIIVGIDYGQSGVTSYSVLFTAGTTVQSVTIPIINDNIREGNETFRVTIDPPSMLGVITGNPNTTVVTIIETTGKIISSL